MAGRDLRYSIRTGGAHVEVHALGWLALAAIILTIITVDIVGHVRTPHEPSMKEAAGWSVAYIAMAVVFGSIV